MEERESKRENVDGNGGAYECSTGARLPFIPQITLELDSILMPILEMREVMLRKSLICTVCIANQ